MDRRTKILASLFGAAVLYGIVTSFVYPRWIKPWFALDEQVADLEKQLDDLNDLVERKDRRREEYRSWIGRSGSLDAGRIVTDVRERLNDLIEKHGLVEATVSPSRIVEEKKTGLQSTVITVTGTGTLKSSIEFLRDASELPHLIRVGNVGFSPAGSSRRGVPEGSLYMRVPIELWVLPQQRVVGRIDPKDVVHPEFYVRHQGRDYSPIWTGEPFSDYVPLVAKVSPPSVQVETNHPATLNVTATGGHGSYSYKWTPVDGLTDPAGASTKVDTSSAGTRPYTVTVTDASGHTAQSTITVVVKEPPPVVKPKKEEVVQKPPSRPQPPPGPKGWDYGKYLELRMALLRTNGDERLDELMAYDSRSREVTYYAVGDEFDGGKLVYVHQTGGLGERGDEFIVYPLGMTLDKGIPAANASDYPELKRAADYFKSAGESATASAEREPESAPASSPTPAVDPKGPGYEEKKNAAQKTSPGTSGQTPEVAEHKEKAAETQLRRRTHSMLKGRPTRRRKPR